MYKLNKQRAIFFNAEPGLTDQAGARETDINVIVKRMAVSGQAPGTTKQPMYEDFTGLPADFRDMIHATRALGDLHKQLPEGLRKLTLEQVNTLTPDEAKRILTPPANPPATPEGETK